MHIYYEKTWTERIFVTPQFHYDIAEKLIAFSPISAIFLLLWLFFNNMLLINIG